MKCNTKICIYHKCDNICGYMGNDNSKSQLGEDCPNFDYDCTECQDRGFKYYECPDCDLTEDEYYEDE